MMDEKFEIKLIGNAAKCMRDCAETLEKILADLKDSAEAPKQKDPEKPITLEDVRRVLAEKSRAGHTAEVKALLIKHGADKLSAIDSREYPSLLAEVEAL